VVKEQLHHYVVIYKVEKSKVESQSKITAMDPAFGKTYTFEEFQKIWTGVLVLLLQMSFRSYNDKVSHNTILAFSATTKPF
jgi:ATP-binding cassette subfamily B protein